MDKKYRGFKSLENNFLSGRVGFWSESKKAVSRPRDWNKKLVDKKKPLQIAPERLTRIEFNVNFYAVLLSQLGETKVFWF